MKSFSIIAHPENDGVGTTLNAVIEWMRTHNGHVRIDRNLAGLITQPLPAHIQLTSTEEDAVAGSDVVLAIGGDGTMLRTARRVIGLGVPILGINSGRLGFLANIPKTQLDDALQKTVDGDYTLDHRWVLEATDSSGERHFALNEFLFSKGSSASMVKLSAYYNDQFINTYWADGLIIATPTGSTAYNMSAGGPIVQPECDVMVLSPISPHTLTTRPLVLPGNGRITIRAEHSGHEVLLSKDGENMDIPMNRIEVQVVRSAHTIDLIQLPGQQYFDTLRTKLMWGLDLREQNGSS
jgi:NAD+ kinase